MIEEERTMSGMRRDPFANGFSNEELDMESPHVEAGVDSDLRHVPEHAAIIAQWAEGERREVAALCLPTMSEERRRAVVRYADRAYRDNETQAVGNALRDALAEGDHLQASLARVTAWAEDADAGRWFDSDYMEAQRHVRAVLRGEDPHSG